MGFPRAEIDRAMRAAFFNPDRAVEYLLNGIPENVQQEQQRGTPRAPTAAVTSPPPQTNPATAPADPSAEGDQPINLFEAAAQANQRSGTGGAARSGRGLAEAARSLNAAPGVSQEAAGQAGNLDFLRSNLQFQQLRQIVQAQPRMLEPILQQVGAGNPQLAHLIGQNPDHFLQLLAEDTEGDIPVPPGAQEVPVTEEERAAIERVSSLLPFLSLRPYSDRIGTK